jgi:hypothetical protein
MAPSFQASRVETRPCAIAATRHVLTDSVLFTSVVAAVMVVSGDASMPGVCRCSRVLAFA